VRLRQGGGTGVAGVRRAEDFFFFLSFMVLLRFAWLDAEAADHAGAPRACALAPCGGVAHDAHGRPTEAAATADRRAVRP